MRKRGWQVLVRGLATEEEKACVQEKLPISKSIVQFHHLSWDILGSGWISGEIRIGKAFFPSYCERLKPQNLYQILLLLFLYAPKLTIYCIGEGHVRCWSYGLVVHPCCAFVGLDQVRLSVLSSRVQVLQQSRYAGFVFAIRLVYFTAVSKAEMETKAPHVWSDSVRGINSSVNRYAFFNTSGGRGLVMHTS